MTKNISFNIKRCSVCLTFEIAKNKYIDKKCLTLLKVNGEKVESAFTSYLLLFYRTTIANADDER